MLFLIIFSLPMIRKTLLLLLSSILCILNGVYSQDNPLPEDVPRVDERSAINVFGGLLAEPCLINQKVGFSMGATIGLTMVDHFYAGGYYVSLVSNIYRSDLPEHNSVKLRCSMNHGGAIIGYVWKPQNLLNLNFNARAGWGRIWYYDEKEDNGDILEDLYKNTRDNIFVVTPGIEFMVTPISRVRIGIGLGYRWVFLIDRYKSSDYSSPVGTISVSFGNFKNKSESESGPDTEL
jgi:hypothetical protein